jgi:tRNA-Thr(GGU) m(6)t(6)A37 methyltransferase TsaA
MVVRPIGFVRSPFLERVSAPRQPCAAKGVRGTIELLADRNFEHALSDLEAWDHIWVIFWFHLNESWRPKVLPPRSNKRRGVFSTRSPHRPNPIGLSVVELESIEGLTLHVRNVDMIDGTPVLDIKPYVPVADAVPSANAGWLEQSDPEPGFEVVWAPLAEEQTRWLYDEHGVELVERVTKVLSLGPEPHPYRRIKRLSEGFCLAVKDWRVYFRVEGRTIVVGAIATGYRARELAESSEQAVVMHRAFVARFGDG